MAIDVGGTATVRFHTRGADGALANFDSVALTITLPDGTTVAPAPTVLNPPAETGTYVYDYTTVQVGRHTVRWLATDAIRPPRAWTDVFDVRSAAGIALVGLDETKRHLNIPAGDLTEDDNLRGFLDSVTDVIEHITGDIVRRTHTETHSGRNTSAICLLHTPVLSITQVKENGQIVDPEGYSLSDAGVLYRVSGFSESRWLRGVNNILIDLVSGRIEVRASVLEAALELIRINFRPQLGGNYSPFDQGDGDDFGTDNQLGPQGQYRLGFFIPNRVMQLLAPHNEGPGIA